MFCLEESKKKSVTIYTDGASRGNPGPAAYAFLFKNEEEILCKESGFLGNKTNNQAEYLAVCFALKKAVKEYEKIIVFSDSKLLVNQLNDNWKVRDNELKKLHDKIKEISEDNQIEFRHVGRENEFIEVADSLCNKTLDKN